MLCLVIERFNILNDDDDDHGIGIFDEFEIIKCQFFFCFLNMQMVFLD